MRIGKEKFEMKGKLLALASIIAGVAMIPTVSAKTLTDLSTDITGDNKVYTVNSNEVTINEVLTITDDVTIDLKGHTLKFTGTDHFIQIDGAHTLTITDSGSNGKIKSDDYGIVATNGATVDVQGGIIDSARSALSSNNTTGQGNFTISNGILTAQKGPAIYMPSQGVLTITNGTINGGISVRMGEINISGGIINAATDNLDEPKDNYSWSGRVFFADALYVLAGSYTQGGDNHVKLNITGGTFNSENGQGSAIAIYDLGKVEQEADISISGNAVLKTNATDRHAYDVLSLADIGVTEPAEGYGDNSGKTTTTISGGTFIGGLEDQYIPDGMVLGADGKLVTPKTEEESSSTETKAEEKNPNTADAIIYSVIAVVISALGLTFAFKKLHN